MPVFAFASLRSTDPGHMNVLEQGVISDAQLLALANESQRDALEALYSAYKSRIYTFLLRFLNDAELADDVTQEVFTKAFHALPKLERDTKILPWLYRVANNAAIDHVRRQRRFTWIRIGAIQHTSIEPQAAEGSDVAEREHVQAVLRTLPPENSAALLLHALEGYSYKEIADIQGVTMTAVRSRIARARAAFKAAYGAGEPPR